MNAEQALGRLRDVVRRQHKAWATESTYVLWLRRYMLAVPGYPEGLTSEQKLERFLTELARDRDISAVSQNQAFNAVLFFYQDVLGQPLQKVDALWALRPARMRTAPSIEHTQALPKTVRNLGGYPTNLIARLLYGCGPRVSEPLNLRIKDVDLKRGRLCIRGAKGGKDRVVALPADNWASLSSRMNCGTATQRTVLNVAQTRARSRPRWGTLRWKPRWAIFTRRA